MNKQELRKEIIKDLGVYLWGRVISRNAMKNAEMIEPFITKLLEQQEKELLERLRLERIYKPYEKENEHGFSRNDFMTGYNQAVNDLEGLKKKEGEHE